MTSAPLVSVCIPTYNGSRYLAECLDSVLAQTLGDFEIVLGDDASTDDTLAVARGYDDPRLRIEAFPTRAGIAANWSRTVALARGEYFALVGQDDRLAPQWAERLVGLLEAHPEADLAFGRREFDIADEASRAAVGQFFEVTYPEMLGRFYPRLETVVPGELMIDAAMDYGFEFNLIGEPTFVMIRRDHPEVAKGYDGQMEQMLDWEFYTRFFAGQPILHCAESLGWYRIHSQNASVDHAAAAKHDREFGHLLEVLAARFAGALTPEQTDALHAKQAEVRAREGAAD